MIYRINKNLSKELEVLEQSENEIMVDHFANKVLKVAFEMAKFDDGLKLKEFEEEADSFYKMNLGLSRYQKVMEKLRTESPRNSKKTSLS